MTYALHDLESRLQPSPRMPVLFVGHGNPMNAISDNPFTRQWTALGQDLPRPQAIVVISAHWLTPGSTRITDAPANEVIYDFGGFPDELYRVQYETRGDREVAQLLAKAFVEYEAKLDAQWGLDHGTWSVLKFLAPEPDVPVLQISIDYAKPLPELYEQFTRLRKLRDRGVIFIGSGNIVHSLQAVRWGGGAPWEWAQQFDLDTAEAITERRVGDLTNFRSVWGEARYAVPTDDHYRPMIAALALLHDQENLDYFNTDIDMGAISMRSFVTALQ